jgi:hypothetical protein
MASPSVAQTATSESSTNADTSHTITLPGSLTTGNTLIVCFGCDGNEGGNVGWPDASWNELCDLSVGTGEVTLAVAWHKVTGSEGASITVTTVGGEGSRHAVYEISGAADPDVAPPEIQTSTGDSLNPDPPSITASLTGYDNMFIAVCGSDRRTVTVFPTNCPDSQMKFAGAPPAGYADCGMASDQLTQDTFDPDTFTLGNVDEWVCATLAVYPTAASAGHAAPLVNAIPLKSKLQGLVS